MAIVKFPPPVCVDNETIEYNEQQCLKLKSAGFVDLSSIVLCFPPTLNNATLISSNYYNMLDFDDSSYTQFRTSGTNAVGYITFDYLLVRHNMRLKFRVSGTNPDHPGVAPMQYIQASRDGETWTGVFSFPMETGVYTKTIDVNDVRFIRFRLHSTGVGHHDYVNLNLFYFRVFTW